LLLEVESKRYTNNKIPDISGMCFTLATPCVVAQPPAPWELSGNADLGGFPET
jgi:hypothetical protein